MRRYEQPRHECCEDTCGLLDAHNSGFSELAYAQTLTRHAREACDGFDPKVVIDTGRNGRGHAGSDCKEWCNIRDAGVGRVPSLATALEVVDACVSWREEITDEEEMAELEGRQLKGGGYKQRIARAQTDTASQPSLLMTFLVSDLAGSH